MLKRIFILIIIGLLVVVGVLAYLKISEQIRILNRETAKIKTMDVQNGAVDMNLYCTGDYMAVEDTVKSYVNSYFQELRQLQQSLQDERIYAMLGIENLQADGPDFGDSLAYLAQKREEVDAAADYLNLYKEEETMREAIDTAGVSEFQRDLYQKAMLETLGTDFFDSVADTDQIRANLKESLSNMEDVLMFLKANAGKWSVENNVLKFESDQLLAEYQALTAKIV